MLGHDVADGERVSMPAVTDAQIDGAVDADALLDIESVKVAPLADALMVPDDVPHKVPAMLAEPGAALPLRGALALSGPSDTLTGLLALGAPLCEPQKEALPSAERVMNAALAEAQSDAALVNVGALLGVIIPDPDARTDALALGDGDSDGDGRADRELDATGDAERAPDPLRAATDGVAHSEPEADALADTDAHGDALRVAESLADADAGGDREGSAGVDDGDEDLLARSVIEVHALVVELAVTASERDIRTLTDAAAVAVNVRAPGEGDANAVVDAEVEALVERDADSEGVKDALLVADELVDAERDTLID